jgi:catalase
VFELSKVLRSDIRARAVSHLVNIDGELAAKVSDGLGIAVPEAAPAARPTADLPLSAKLSILGNGPADFRCRKVGVLLTDGSSAALFGALMDAIESEGSTWEVIAPRISGVVLDDGTSVPAGQKVGGGPSVLYDAVVVMPSAKGAALLAKDAAAKDFCADAFGHFKFIGFTSGATELFDAARIPEMDGGFVPLGKAADAFEFVTTCRALRFWARELVNDPAAAA